MEVTIKSGELHDAICSQLRQAQYDFVGDVFGVEDRQIGNHKFAIYSAIIVDEDGDSYSVWVVSGGPGDGDCPNANLYHDSYYNMNTAFALHVGSLVVSGMLELCN